MRQFAFIGKLPASKSMMNRLLIAQSYGDFKIIGESDCEDVRLMEAAMSALNLGQTFQAGSAGTVLRFLALRLSRIPGHHRIEGEKRLFSRPQEELSKILRQVGVQTHLSENALELESSGWKMQGDTLLIPADRSSQFASAVLLNAWDLPFDLYVALSRTQVSLGYWKMTVQLAQKLGMKIDFWDSDFRVPRGQRPQGDLVQTEIDMSSTFALAAIAAVSGSATFLDFPKSSLQPDAQFVNILQSMNVPITWAGDSLKVARAPKLGGVAVNLKSAPDLFPVLAALCALAEGESDLFGAPQLHHKESDRIQNMADWIVQLGRKVEVKPDGIRIYGELPSGGKALTLDCDQDHRLAFAAAVWRSAGHPIIIKNPEVVEKSFPKFWDILGWDA